MAYKTVQKQLRESKNTQTGIKNFADPERFRDISGRNRENIYKSKTKNAVPKDRNGNSGVRASMTNMGLDNSKIGWKDGYVTYQNLKFKPASVENGTSYAPVSDIQGFVESVYRAEGKNPVRVTDYAAPAGMSGISYSQNGLVSVGGENIPVLYMDGDRAVVDRRDLDNAYKKLLEQNGISTAENLYSDWSRDYKADINRAYGAMADYGEWKYNPAQDPAYRAYSDMYQREAERAYKDAAAKMASKNNGNMTSAAQNVANQQIAYYMSQLADRIPELQKNAYERYSDGYDMKRQNYDLLREEAAAEWERRNSANETAKSDYSRWMENERQRTVDSQNDMLAAINADTKRIENESAKLRQAGEAETYRQAEFDNMWENAERRGYFTDTEGRLWNIPKNAEGEYLTPNDIKIQNENRYFNETTAPQLEYRSNLEFQSLLKEYEEKRKYEIEKAQRDYEYDKLLAAYRAGLK